VQSSSHIITVNKPTTNFLPFLLPNHQCQFSIEWNHNAFHLPRINHSRSFITTERQNDYHSRGTVSALTVFAGQHEEHPACKRSHTSNHNYLSVVKVVLWSGGELTWRSQVGANPIPIPTPLIWRYLGIK